MKVVGVIILILLIGLGLFLFIPVAKTAEHRVTWGLTFSPKMATELGVNWREAFTAMVTELEPQELRLIAYWDSVQPEQPSFDFADLDWQMDQAESKNIPVVLAMGQKTPRWPECHVPAWVTDLSKADKELALKTYLETVVTRYKSRTNIKYWQVENEPFIHFGNCGTADPAVLDKEIAWVRAADSEHKILMTDGGAWGRWYGAATRGDAFGTTLYTKVYREGLGYTRPPFPPAYYQRKANVMRKLVGKLEQPFIFTEIGLEPWGGKSIAEMTLEEQQELHSLKDFRGTVAFARNTGFDTFYLWGEEWWYALKTQGITTYWQEAKQTMAGGKSENYTQSFPKDFLWGAATASHQVEGNTQNDWSEWEQANAARLANQAPALFAAKAKDWQAVQDAATSEGNYISGSGADHYNRYQEDFTLAQSLGMNAQRISLEWARIEPERGDYNQAEIAHYKAVIADMRAKGMEPFVTLWHYTLPTWFRDAGGWENPESATWFAAYAKTVAEALGNDVTYWMTINEPGVYANNAYLSGLRPPQKRNPLAFLRARANLVKAHKLGYMAIKGQLPDAKVGIAQDVYSYDPPRGSLGVRIMRPIARWWSNRSFLNAIVQHQDFIGINYYMNVAFGQSVDVMGYSDLGWPLYPQGIKSVLVEMKRYNKPIYITENGLADAGDSQRAQFIESTLREVAAAIREGVDVQGYFYWSLLDNFEWEKGFWPRFGLIAVDYDTKARTIRPSAWEYAKIIAAQRNR